MNQRKVKLLPPVEHTGLRIQKPAEKAAGMKAVAEAMADVREEVGVLDGIGILNKMNKQDGFDCPGCAWPDPKKRSPLGEYCENGAKALAEEATNKTIGGAFFNDHSVEELSLLSDHQLGKKGRIIEPMILRKDSSRYQPIAWDEAFEYIAAKLNALNSPDEAIFYTSGRTSNEAAYLYQLFVRIFGTNNLPDCSNMCHESSGTGLSETIGIGKGTVTLEDLHKAGLIIVMGQNPGTNHPRMLSALEKCKENGGRIVSVNPIAEAGTLGFVDPQSPVKVLKGGTSLADMHVPLRINTDVALLKGIMRLLLDIEKDAPGTFLDLEFIEKRTAGFDELRKDLEQVDPSQMADLCGISFEQLSELANWVALEERIIITWAMGLTQHENAVANIHQVVNLLLMKGSIGKEGAGACPVRGHSNVQGDRTMGIWEKPKEAFLKKLDERYSFKAPREHGFDVLSAIEAMHAQKAKVFFAMGGNFISATPDSELTSKALMNCELSVQVSTKLNRSHLVTGSEAIILPCLARSERDAQKGGLQFVSVENSMGIVHRSQGSRAPISEKLMSEPAIVCALANATFRKDDDHPNGPNWSAFATNYDLIRNEIEACIPGFEDYNERVRKPNGFELPNGPRNGEFTTPSGKAHFMVDAHRKWDLTDDRFLMMTIRTHDQFNTTIYGLDDRYRGILNERRVVLMNRTDMKRLALNAKDHVDLISEFKGRKRHAPDFIVVPYDIAKGCVATYFPEANVLVPINQKAHRSHTPASKSVVVSIQSR